MLPCKAFSCSWFAANRLPTALPAAAINGVPRPTLLMMLVLSAMYRTDRGSYLATVSCRVFDPLQQPGTTAQYMDAKLLSDPFKDQFNRTSSSCCPLAAAGLLFLPAPACLLLPAPALPQCPVEDPSMVTSRCCCCRVALLLYRRVHAHVACTFKPTKAPSTHAQTLTLRICTAAAVGVNHNNRTCSLSMSQLTNSPLCLVGNGDSRFLCNLRCCRGTLCV